MSSLTGAIGNLVGEVLPDVVADAIERLAEDADGFDATVLNMLAGYVRIHGPEAIDEAVGLIDGVLSARTKKNRGIKLFDMHQAGLEISTFADELQTAEASQRKRAARLGAIVAVIFRGFGAQAREALIDAID